MIRHTLECLFQMILERVQGIQEGVWCQVLKLNVSDLLDYVCFRGMFHVYSSPEDICS